MQQRGEAARGPAGPHPCSPARAGCVGLQSHGTHSDRSSCAVRSYPPLHRGLHRGSACAWGPEPPGGRQGAAGARRAVVGAAGGG
eukprot:15437343-Alexandrium_andersonii.AAC.1